MRLLDIFVILVLMWLCTHLPGDREDHPLSPTPPIEDAADLVVATGFPLAEVRLQYGDEHSPSDSSACRTAEVLSCTWEDGVLNLRISLTAKEGRLERPSPDSR